MVFNNIDASFINWKLVEFLVNQLKSDSSFKFVNLRNKLIEIDLFYLKNI